MKTRITELFKIKYPIILSGMSWISVPEMVAAVSNAGGLGYLATGPLSADETRNSIKRIRELTDKPFGGGVTLLMPGSRENAEVLLEEKVPVINISLGKGTDIIERCHAYGGKVIQTVTTEKHSLAAVKSGADALQVTGYEAAAHGSAVGSVALIPAIAQLVEVPVVAAGGFGDGRGLVAALALGAEGIAMGTRLALTKESPVHENTKKFTIEKGVEDTIYSDRFDGLFARVIKSPTAEKAIKRGMSLPRAFFASRRAAREMNLPWFKLMMNTMLRGPEIMLTLAHFVTAVEAIKLITIKGDTVKGVQLSGQVQGLINDLPTVAEVMKRTIAEAKSIQESLQKKLK
jgi:enoyl-[acyl-carrier protein] reductase II